MILVTSWMVEWLLLLLTLSSSLSSNKSRINLLQPKTIHAEETVWGHSNWFRRQQNVFATIPFLDHPMVAIVGGHNKTVSKDSSKRFRGLASLRRIEDIGDIQIACPDQISNVPVVR